MHTTNTKAEFICYRSQGWSLARIAEHLHVSKPTLVEWNRQFGLAINALRAVELEALHEKFLTAHEQDLAQLVARQTAVERELAKRKLDDVPTEKLFHLAALLRQQLDKARAGAQIMQGRSQFLPLPHLPSLPGILNQFKDGTIDNPSPIQPLAKTDSTSPQ